MRATATGFVALLALALEASAACPVAPAFQILRAEDLSDGSRSKVRVDVRLAGRVDQDALAGVACQEIAKRLLRRELHEFELRAWGAGSRDEDPPDGQASWGPPDARRLGDLASYVMSLELAGQPVRRVTGLVASPGVPVAAPPTVREQRPAAAAPAPAAPAPAAPAPAAPAPAAPAPAAPAPAAPAPAAPAPAMPAVAPDAVEAAERAAADIMALVERWRVVWEARELDLYMSFYAPDFGADGLDLAAWRRQKGKSFDASRQIQVTLEEPRVQLGRDRAVVTFLQRYASDRHADVGTKTLYLEKRNGVFQILRETWAPVGSEEALPR